MSRNQEQIQQNLVNEPVLQSPLAIIGLRNRFRKRRLLQPNPLGLPFANLQTQIMANNIINNIRAGSIGGVSGVKGSSAAGAIGGGTLMVLTGLASLSDQVGFGFVVLSLIMGLTTGMMTGALIGYAMGWINGMLSGVADADPHPVRISAVWYPTLMIVWAVVGFYLFQQNTAVGVFGGLLAGFLAAWISTKDFVYMIEVQSAEVNPDDLRTDKDRWKHPEESSVTSNQ